MIKQKYWHALFEASVFIKAVNGIWETIGGIALLFLSNGFINRAFASQSLTEHITAGTKNFAGIYILAHGLINIFLAYYLYKEKLWAFWVSIGFFSGSVVYLVYRLTDGPSPMLFALIAFDVFFTYLTWHEFKYRTDQAKIKLQNSAE